MSKDNKKTSDQISAIIVNLCRILTEVRRGQFIVENDDRGRLVEYLSDAEQCIEAALDYAIADAPSLFEK